jgi:hypothetical protein
MSDLGKCGLVGFACSKPSDQLLCGFQAKPQEFAGLPRSGLYVALFNPPKHIKKIPPRHNTLSEGHFFSVVNRKLL